VTVRAALGMLCLLSACQVISGLDNLGVAHDVPRDASMLSDPDTCTTSAGVCDLVSQCGCPAGQSCQYRGVEPRCYATGTMPLGAACSTNEQCAPGSGCLDGLCKRYCGSDDDCGNGLCLPISENDKPLPNVKACLTRCDFVSQAPCAEGSQCAQLNARAPDQFGVDGTFCFVPLSTCVADQRCDEPAWGTRVCSEGSDSADCTCKSSVAGATCDLTTQCGCSPGMHCALADVVGTQAGLTCAPDQTSPKQRGEPCHDELECAAGYSCWRGLCEKYCTSDGDCAPGQCIPLGTPAVVSGVHICTIPCNFAMPTTCAVGSACVHAPGGRDYCLIPRSPCPYAGDGVCDEPEGTRICVEGSDPMDCR
jgi:hypothetical protein